MYQVISLGSSVGSGLFIATGKALADAGPASMLLAYFMVCIGIWANLQTLTEMTIAFPTSGNYINYAGRLILRWPLVLGLLNGLVCHLLNQDT